jgi:hypothetical protein
MPGIAHPAALPYDFFRIVFIRCLDVVCVTRFLLVMIGISGEKDFQ